MKSRALFVPVLLFVCLAAAIALSVGVYQPFKSFPAGDVHIALVGPMTGPQSMVGRTMRQSAALYIDQVNKSGGVNGHRVVLDVYDDRNDPDIARKAARAVASDGRAIAVVGHHYSDCSLAGGEVYKEAGIPAITPMSTNVQITKDNPWYFRALYDDSFQGQFLAKYAVDILEEKQVSVIFAQDGYSLNLAKSFEETARSLGAKVMYRWEFDEKSPDLEQRLRRIVFELQTKPDAGAVFLAAHAAEGVALVRLIKDTLVKNTLLGPDAFATQRFPQGFAGLPKERRNPGHYTDGLYVASPLLYDTADEPAHQFRDRYRQRYGEEPGWEAAYTRDSVMLAAAAFRAVGTDGRPMDLAEQREAVRDYWARLDSLADAEEGITGRTYFDADGNAMKPLTMGVFHKRNIISALTQFHPVQDLMEAAVKKKEAQDGEVVLFGGRYMYKTNVVYTGIQVNGVSAVDLSDLTCVIDCHVWFRYQDAFDVDNIVFGNAVDPVEMTPVESGFSETDHLKARLYHVKGRFRMDFLPTPYMFDQHILGFRFRHRDRSRNQLIYVTDAMGMGITAGLSPRRQMEEESVLPGELGWHIQEVDFFQDTDYRYGKAKLRYLNFQNQNRLDFSRFNFAVRVARDRFSLRGRMDPQTAWYAAGFSAAAALLLGILWVTRYGSRHSRFIWLLMAFSTFTLLLSGEVVVLIECQRFIPADFFRRIAIGFDMLWWIAPAFFLNLAMEPFVWQPMRRKSGKGPPDVLRRLTAYIIYFLAFYGIVVFVFDQNITKLMATSGAIAMIIGFIIKANISNFFSGIVIHQGSAIEVGDRVKIGGYEPGVVTDITWRSTKLKMEDGAVLHIPNSAVSESAVHNYEKTGGDYSVELTVHVSPDHPPQRIKKLLQDAVMSVDGVLREPDPSVDFAGITEWSAAYTVSFSVGSYGQRGLCRKAVWERIWNQLKIARIQPALRYREFQVSLSRKRSAQRSQPTPRSVIEDIDIFQPLGEEAKTYLSRRMSERSFPPGSIIVAQGDTGDSMFIIVEGVINVVVDTGADARIDVVRMGAGGFFGEMALLTGQARTATIMAVTDTLLYEITKDDIAPLITDNPEISDTLSRVLAQRRSVLEEKKQAASENGQENGSDQNRDILSRIRAFFGS